MYVHVLAGMRGGAVRTGQPISSNPRRQIDLAGFYVSNACFCCYDAHRTKFAWIRPPVTCFVLSSIPNELKHFIY